uniref:Uncharacterized protein n=1 Tax=Anopheles minimus TaxID=112268 RepID=A0A182WN19_9DIPT
MHPDEEVMDIDEAPENIIINLKSNKIRSRKGRGIRHLQVSLATRAHKTTNRQIQVKETTCTLRLFFKLFLIAVGMGVAIVYMDNTNNLGQHLKNNYYTAYERLSQLSNNLRLERQANFTPILEAIDDNIIGQRHLHGELNDWFRAIGNSTFTCALFVGGTGVGKSFTANIIAKYYPYTKNILYLSGKDVTDGKTRYTTFKTA